MSAAISCSWDAMQGAEEADISVFHAPRGTDQMPCEICVQRGALPVSGIEIISNASTCEVYEQYHSSSRPSYVSTIRGTQSAQEAAFLISANLQVPFQQYVLLANFLHLVVMLAEQASRQSLSLECRLFVLGKLLGSP